MLRVNPGRAERGRPASTVRAQSRRPLPETYREALFAYEMSSGGGLTDGDRGGGDCAGRACGSAACAAEQAACIEQGALNARLAEPHCLARLSHATPEARIASRSR